MATNNSRIQHVLGGGLASDFGSSTFIQAEGGVAVIPFLLEANNIWFTLDGGVEKVHIIDGRIRHSLLLEIFTDAGVGTQIVRETTPAAHACPPRNGGCSGCPRGESALA